MEIFANIFSQYLNCIFTYLMMFFKAQKHFILVKSNLPISSFIAYAVTVASKKSLLDQKSQRCTPVFSSKGFIFLVLTFRSVSHFELMFAHSVKEGSIFILLNVGIHAIEFFPVLSNCYFLPLTAKTILSLFSCLGPCIYIFKFNYFVLLIYYFLSSLYFGYNLLFIFYFLETDI